MSTDNDTLEIVDLDSVLSEDLSCQSRAHWVQCTHKVTHIYSTACGDRTDIPVCADAHAYVIKAWEDGYCSGCLEDCSECWTIRPI